MRARFINEINFERGQDPKDALKIGHWEKNIIKKAIEEMAAGYGKEMKIYDEDPEYFTAGFEQYGHVYSIGLNPDSEGVFNAQFENGERPETDERECQTIEDAKDTLSDWIDYAEDNQDTEGICPECGEWLEDTEESCGYCENDENDEEEEEEEDIDESGITGMHL